ncbi:hypothetical protein [Acinetobacter sp. HR7]|uniref:hypothetical protein n=1 Tax=Acinetobacter sp. HR7 TaxID=1509403 RepID=UPI0005511C8C|nr:hypothetical protein [Acinetobacter sp. HR7]
MAITIRLRDDEEEMVKNAALDMMIEKKTRIKESDVIHTLIRMYLPQLKTADVMKYREEILGKDD